MIKQMRASYFHNFKNAQYCALSDDPIPDDLENGDEVYIIDQGKIYYWDESSSSLYEYKEGGRGSGGSSSFVPCFGSLATVSLGTTWSGDDPYVSTVTVTGYTVTNQTMVSVLPSSDVVDQMLADGITNIFITNNDGVLTATVIGATPTVPMTLQVLCTESDISSDIAGLPSIVGSGIIQTVEADNLTDAVNILGEDVDDLKNAIDELDNALNDIYAEKNNIGLWVQKKISVLGELQDDDYSISTTDYLADDITSAEVVEPNYAMRLFGYKADGTCLYCWNGASFAYGYTNIQSFNLEDIRSSVPAARYFRISIVKANGALKVTTADYSAVSMAVTLFYTKAETNAKLQTVKNAIGTVYVSTTGNDSADGSISNPLATVNRALEIGATNVCMMSGIYDQRIDMSKCVSNALNIFAYDPLERVIFRLPNSLIAESETAVNGYTRVYSATCQRSIPTQISRVFQDGVPDATTEITKSERHPLQRGYFYRCEDTKIYRTTATALQDALTEIEQSTQYKYFVSDNTIYFSRPQALSATHPLRTSNYFDNELFYNLIDPYAKKHNPVKLTASGIETKYLIFNVSGTVNAVVSDCKSANAYLNGFKYNYALNAKFVRCEACNAFTETLGDGFSSAGDPNNEFAKGSTVTLIDCWAHDNTDDGFSDHKGCETTIYGGLFEYNGKAGITPTGGDHCTCYNVLSRRNYCGFLYGGSAEISQAGDGMNGGQLVCYDCIAESNIYGEQQNNAGFFLSGFMNTMLLVNCKSINNKVGYYGRSLSLEQSQGYDPTEGVGSMVLIDCGAAGNDYATQNNESIETRNTQVIEIV